MALRRCQPSALSSGSSHASKETLLQNLVPAGTLHEIECHIRLGPGYDCISER